jgi:hypothetical protein
MKKITFFLMALVASFGIQAQNSVAPSTYAGNAQGGTNSPEAILSQSLDQTLDLGTVACANSASGYTTENSWYRTYNPSDFGYSGNFEVQGVQFAHTYTENGAPGTALNAEIRAWTTDDPFPFGILTEVAFEALVFDVSTADVLTDYMFSTPVVIAADSEVIIELFIESGETFLVDSRIYGNELGELSPSYLASASCNITTPVTMADIGFPDNTIVFN